MRNNYDIIVLSDGISSENQKVILQEVQQKNIMVRFVDAQAWLENKSLYTARHLSRTTYLRLAVVDILSNYDKVIYLDCDLVVNRDIGELYATDVSGYMVAAVKDTVMGGWCCQKDKKGEEQREYNRRILGLSEEQRYFNAGVMILNLAEFRKRGYTSDKLLEMAAARKWTWFDQDLLNKLCCGSVVYLNSRWNVMVHPFEFENEMAEFHLPDQEYAAYWSAITDPYIVHYAGRALPVYDPTVERGDLFWRYARKTSRFGQLQNDMRQEILRQHNERSVIRKIADIIVPYGSKRRSVLRKFIGSKK